MSESLTVDELIEKYAKEGREEFAADEAQRSVEREQLHAAFEAGAPLEVRKPLEIWDPIDSRAVAISTGTVLTVATHEGDIFIGELADNSHSIGVLYEEAQRWYTRKYFLPLALMCDPVYVQVADEAVEFRGQLKGLEQDGEDGSTAIAIKRLEELALKDDAAIVPRGVKLVLRHGATAKDPATGESVHLIVDTEVTVVEAVADGAVDEFPDIPVEFEGRRLDLPFEVLRDLDPEADVLTLREQEQLADEVANRRRALRKMFGIGLGVVSVASGVGMLAGGVDRQAVLTALVPEMGALYGFFSAGGAHWNELHGAALDLKGQGCAAAVRALGRRFDAIAAESDLMWTAYENAYRVSVHTDWNETRHYRTDKDGGRHYTHSSWSKGYTTMWVEPGALEGDNHTVGAWRTQDGHRRERAERLTRERIFDLLASAGEDAESTFHLERVDVDFARDAAVSAFFAAAFTLPVSYYDRLIDLVLGKPFWTDKGKRAPYQKPGLLITGAVLGVVLAERDRRSRMAVQRENKYLLGHLLENELVRIPKLSFIEAWTQFFGDPAPRNLVSHLQQRRVVIERVQSGAVDFSYTYGSGYDNGRSLDSIHIDSSGVRHTFGGREAIFSERGADLDAFLRVPAHTKPLHTVIRNAVGTETLDIEMGDQESTAQGGKLRRATWFAVPVWGAVVADLMIKAASK